MDAEIDEITQEIKAYEKLMSLCPAPDASSLYAKKEQSDGCAAAVLSSTASPAASPHDTGNPTLRQRIVHLLSTTDQPLGVSEMTNRLSRVGPAVSVAAVSSMLSKCVKAGDVARTGRKYHRP